MAAATETLGRRGPFRGGRDIRMSRSTADAAGVSRTTLYRHWETSADLAAALTVHTATRRRGWREIVAELTPVRGLAAAVDAAVRATAADPGPSVRAAVASWPASPAQAEVRAWERRWLRDLAGLLERTYGADGPRPWTDLAIAVTAFVEGTLLLCSQMRRTPPPAMGATCDRHVRTMIEMTSGPDVPLEVDAGERAATHPSAARILERLDGLLADPANDPDWAKPTRLVDLEHLARTLGVNTRTLYSVWPTAHDLNGDVALQAVRSQRELTERLTLAAISTTVGQSHTHFRDLFVSVLEAIIGGASTSLVGEYLACAFALTDDAVAERVAPEIERWVESQKLSLLALLQVIGFHLLPDVDPDRYVMGAFGATFGCERISILHPDLDLRTITMLDGPVRSLPGGVNALFRSMTEPCDHDPRPVDDRHSMAPALVV